MTQAVDPKDRYVEAFRRFSQNGASASPGWLKQLRETAISRFAAVGFPSSRQEEWRFTDVTPLARTPFALSARHGAAAVGVDAYTVEQILGGPASVRIVFVDGVLDPRLSSASGLPPSVRVGSLGQALTRDRVVEAHLGRYANPERNPFTALSTAFIQDGGFVYVPRGVVVEHPIHLVFLSTARADGTVSHPRNLVVLEQETAATVVETYAAVAEAEYFTNAVTEFVVGDAAWGTHLRVQREAGRAYHTATSQSYQGRDSHFFSLSVALGASLSRHDLNAVLDGPGALLLLNGLSVLRDSQHVDHHTSIDHARPQCESHEFFNGIFDQQARGVFNGRIIVRPGAQRTDSKQTNNNVLLSATARANSQPQLEIYADDVKCTHGATIGPLDPNALFYLGTRGVGQAEARQLLTYGFAADILSRVAVPELRERLDRLVRAHLAA